MLAGIYEVAENKFGMKKMFLLTVTAILLIGILPGCSQVAQKSDKGGVACAIRMADSEMKHFPEPWSVDYNPKPIWNYTQGLVAQSMLELWKTNGGEQYYNYAKTYADKLIDANGAISEYKLEEYNIDRLNSGKFLFILYEVTKDERYAKAINYMRHQLDTHPRTSEGGFWHKKRYPHQMWLDGLYMGAPFYAQYAVMFSEPAAFDDILLQFTTVHKHTYNPETGLNYHGWDESKTQRWADKSTGCSPNYWGRAEGWYAMALVDVLDFFPKEHPGYQEIIKILNQVVTGVVRYQDAQTGLWYQVIDQGNREGNYLEATASSMFAYAILKAVRKGYIAPEYKDAGVKGYNGIVSKLIKDNGDGTISLTNCCSVAGLGGDPYRDGSFEYYIGEEVRDNDPKGVGPFIKASLEYEKISSIN